MSTELAITAVTRTLRTILDQEIPHKLGIGTDVLQPLEVTTLPPHKVREVWKAENVVNLFLYRTDLNPAWRNQGLPSQGLTGTSPPPLALNLEYLVTAYGEGEQEDIAHYYLGAAMRVLHDCTVIPRERLKAEVEAKSRVHQQLENLRVSQRPLSIEEMSKLWSIFQTQYRISAAYLVTVVLIDSRTPARSALPVLKRGPEDRGVSTLTTQPPTLDTVASATGFAAARLGEVLNLSGAGLEGGTPLARLRHPSLTAALELPAIVVDAERATVALPAAAPGSGVAHAWPAGVYTAALSITRPGQPPWITNEVPFALAPSIARAPASHVGPDTSFELTIEARPQVREGQTVLVLWDDQQIKPKAVNTPVADADAPTTIKADVKGPKGMHRVRLRVDGIDSVPLKKVGDALDFDPEQSVEVLP